MQEVERWHDFRSRSKIKCGRMQCAGRMKCMGVSHFPRLRHGSAAIIRRRRQNVCQSKQNKREKMQQQDEKKDFRNCCRNGIRQSFFPNWMEILY